MPKIFISYRRADSQYVTDAIYEYFKGHFGADNVFLDVGNIPFGVDFRNYLREQVEAHDVVLVIIGPDWGRIMHERASEANDFVRIEIENALQQNKLIIPVLVMNAQMPDFRELPESIQELQWRNSAQVRRQPDFSNDCSRIRDVIKQHFPAITDKFHELNQTELGKRIFEIIPPPFVWVTIQAGEVETDKAIYEIPVFQIAKYPVTNAQFAKFIGAGGYQDDKWWTEEGWQHRQKGGWVEPLHWNDYTWNNSESPVVGISWFEAVAFCNWLGEQILSLDFSSKHQVGEQRRVMLPTDLQWQRAARGDNPQDYPWGYEWDCQKCNNSVSPCSHNQTTPVDQYEGVGNSPFGIVDMVGNTWEWCLTDFDDRTEDIHSYAKYRGLRGGSWHDTAATDFSVTSPVRSYPYTRDNRRGFRVALT